jgi:hypothetical protein
VSIGCRFTSALSVKSWCPAHGIEIEVFALRHLVLHCLFQETSALQYASAGRRARLARMEVYRSTLRSLGSTLFFSSLVFYWVCLFCFLGRLSVSSSCMAEVRCRAGDGSEMAYLGLVGQLEGACLVLLVHVRSIEIQQGGVSSVRCLRAAISSRVNSRLTPQHQVHVYSRPILLA